MILTPWWSKGLGTEAVRQMCGIAFRELALERIIGEVFPENLASARVLEKNGFRLEETKVGAVVKGGTAVECYGRMVYTSRLIYNDSVTKLNSALGMFPTNVIAGILGFHKREYLSQKGD
jgi:hypothetical protein